MEKILNICGAKMLALDQLSQVTENQLDLVNNLVIYTCEWTLLLTCIRGQGLERNAVRLSDRPNDIGPQQL